MPWGMERRKSGISGDLPGSAHFQLNCGWWVGNSPVGLHEAIRKLYFDQSNRKASTQYFFISRLIYLKGLKLILPLQYFLPFLAMWVLLMTMSSTQQPWANPHTGPTVGVGENPIKQITSSLRVSVPRGWVAVPCIFCIFNQKRF